MCAVAWLVAASGMAQERRWEVEVYGGAAGRAASSGSQTLPPAGAPLVTSSPIFPSREVPSWFFGDGATLLNGVIEDFGVASRIVPLDPLFGAAHGGWTGTAGARVHKRISPRTSAEVSVDWLGKAPASADLASTIEVSRTSFTSAFAGLLATGPFSATAIGATASSDAGDRREIAVTGAFNLDAGRLGPFAPYVTIGGGVLAGMGTDGSAELTGHYRFAVLGEVPFDESDHVTLGFERPASFVVVLGGGLRRDLSDAWGLRLDVRALVGPDSSRVTVGTAATNVRGTPAAFVESFTNPAIQFSNDAATGRRSTLSAPALDAVRVFSGGARAHTLVTFAISRRF